MSARHVMTVVLVLAMLVVFGCETQTVKRGRGGMFDGLSQWKT